MGLIIKIAWRNVLRHKGKSLVIGVILFLGALIMTFGNGVLSGMDKGLSRNIVQSFTGHAVLVSDKQESDNVFLDMMGKAIEPINNMVAIRRVLDSVPFVERYLPMGKNAAMVLNEAEEGTPDGVFLIGVDFGRWQEMFPGNAKVIEGRMARGGERGLMVPDGLRKIELISMNLWMIAKGDSLHTERLPEEARKNPGDIFTKDNIVFMGLSTENSSTDVRADVLGVFQYKALNTIWGSFIIMDIESYRECLGYFAASDQVEISADKKEVFSLDNTSLDDMFSTDDMMTANTAFAPPVSITRTPAAKGAQPERNVDLDIGAYNLVTVFLKPGVTVELGVAQLNTALKERNLGVRAVTWKKAIGTIGSMAVLIKSALFVFVMLLFFVAIIIIVNTLSMAALERTNEIGMMRAVGARKGFITRMFMGETAMLSAVFGGAGIVVGVIAVNIVAMLGISTDNDILQLLYGGDTFKPLLTTIDIILAAVQLVLVTLIAVIYPVQVAQSITPLDAIARD